MKRKKYCIYLVPAFLIFCCFVIFWRDDWIYYVTSPDKHVTFGESVKVDLDRLIRSEQNEKLPKVGYNIINSRNVGAIRTLPDTRHESCVSSSNLVLEKHPRIPRTSVVITVDQAERSVIVRNTLSLVLHAEPVTIYELIVVFDGINDSTLENYLVKIPRVTVIKHDSPKGRALSRMKGVSMARGEIIVFVDSLTEMNADWLAPLVLRLMESPKSIVVPVFDVIDHLTFSYYSLSELYRLGFDWSLKSHLEQLSLSYVIHSDPVTVFRSPLMNGNVYAIKRDFFIWLGQYDYSFWAYTIDDMEFSLRAWLCGGQIEVIPCSRVGVINIKQTDSHTSFNNYLRHHIDVTTISSFQCGTDDIYAMPTVVKGRAKRIAEVWLDEYKRFFYAVRPSARMQPIADVSNMRKSKEKLKCKGFKWFLTSVYPQLQPLVYDEVAFGNIRQGENCLDLDPGQLPLIAKLRQCEMERNSQEWSWRKTGNIVSNGMCLTSNLMDMRTYVLVNFCKEFDNNQIWYRHEEKIVHMDTNLCLDAQQGSTGLIITDCIKGKTSQFWIISTEHNEELNI